MRVDGQVGLFQYVPTGQVPEMDYMTSPEQRAELHRKVVWNDGSFVDGCMAGGERYIQVIAHGDVGPVSSVILPQTTSTKIPV